MTFFCVYHYIYDIYRHKMPIAQVRALEKHMEKCPYK